MTENTETGDSPKAISGEKKAEIAPPPAEKHIGHEEKKILEAGKVREMELEERLLRLQAEFENYKKRAARENEMRRENAMADAMLKLLPLVDDFGMAMAHIGKSTHKDFEHGMELIYAKMLDLLKKEGVEEMKALGESFDPYKHDALRQGDGPEGKVIEVIQKGYVFRGKILRHAKVVVGKGGDKNE